MNARLKKLEIYMEQRELDMVLISHPKHIYYFTGFITEPHERFLGLVLLRDRDPFLLVPLLDREKATESSMISSIHTVADDQNAYDILKALLPSGLRRIGLEEGTTTVTRYRALLQSTGAAETVDVQGKLQEMRMIKSPEEVATIKNSIRTMEEALRLCLKQIRVGMTEMDVVAELEYQMKKQGADEPSFATIALSGDRGNNDVAFAGMVFTIEPGIYVPQKAGVRIEDNVLVTANGVEVLTSFPKELTVVGFGE